MKVPPDILTEQDFQDLGYKGQGKEKAEGRKGYQNQICICLHEKKKRLAATRERDCKIPVKKVTRNVRQRRIKSILFSNIYFHTPFEIHPEIAVSVLYYPVHSFLKRKDIRTMKRFIPSKFTLLLSAIPPQRPLPRRDRCPKPDPPW